MKYRADIDGLRAIAVLAVVIFHIHGLLPGGFVGVDIFFVISGYLIGGLILTDLSGVGFSLSQFYERRIRRIFPALFAMLAACAAVAWFCLYPTALVDFAKSAAAVALSGSNLYFWKTSDYFAGLAQSKPLLHTWSLGVEEQFYIVFPLVLIAARRFAPGRSRLILIVLAAVSVAASQATLLRSTSAAFYLPYSRAFELLIGSLVAAGAYPTLSNRVVREAVALAGAVLMAWSLITMRADAPFPGMAALAPCLGAAMLIAAGRDGQTLPNLVLAAPPLVFIGLISYSLYLWHWPALVLAPHLFGLLEFSLWQKVTAVCAAFVLATLTWWLVERPFRRLPANRLAVFTAAILVVAAVVGLAASVILGKGFPARFSPEVARLASYLGEPHDDYFRSGDCFINNGRTYRDFKPRLCVQRRPDRSNLLLVGDSFGGHLWRGLSRALPTVNVMQVTAIGCKPTIRPAPGQTAPECLKLINDVYTRYLPRDGDVLVLAASWNVSDLPALADSLAWARVHGVGVIVVGPPPTYNGDLPWLLATEVRMHRPGLAAAAQTVKTRDIDRRLSELAAAEGAQYASEVQALCTEQDCRRVTPGGAPMQFDAGHLTREGTDYVGARLAAQPAFATLAH
jgi:peptidoglycan/LPS O-acetylase OafA/YrhL